MAKELFYEINRIFGTTDDTCLPFLQATGRIDIAMDYLEKELLDSAEPWPEPVNHTSRRSRTLKYNQRTADLQKKKLADLSTYADYLRKDPIREVVRNDQTVAYIKKGNTWTWNKNWKRSFNKTIREEGKKEIRDFMSDLA